MAGSGVRQGVSTNEWSQASYVVVDINGTGNALGGMALTATAQGNTTGTVNPTATGQGAVVQGSAVDTTPPPSLPRYRSLDSGAQRGIGGTDCTARADDAHLSKHSGYSEIGAKAGIENCGVDKKSIWAEVALYKWNSSKNNWVEMKRFSSTTYGIKSNIKFVGRKCFNNSFHWYQVRTTRGTIIDKDGDRHYMRFGAAGAVRGWDCGVW